MIGENEKVPLAEPKKCDSWYLNDDERVLRCCQDLKHKGDHSALYKEKGIYWWSGQPTRPRSDRDTPSVEPQASQVCQQRRSASLTS